MNLPLTQTLLTLTTQLYTTHYLQVKKLERELRMSQAGEGSNNTTAGTTGTGGEAESSGGSAAGECTVLVQVLCSYEMI